MTIEYINYWDNGKVAREKINNIFHEVEASIPSIWENWHWYIGWVDTWITAVWFTLRDFNNLIQRNSDLEAYVDLQIASGITPNDDFQVWVTVGKILETDGWNQDWLLLNRQTTNGDYARLIYGNDWKIYFDGWNGTWNQIYKKSEVDGLFSTLRSELSSVAFSGDYWDLNNKPTIWTATLTIQKNGTTVNTFGANATANVTANISVPTKTSDITNDSWFITKEVADLTNYTPSSSLSSVATSWDYDDLLNKPTIPENTSDLTNDSWFIDKDVDNLTNYTKTEDLPTVWTAKITIQKNGVKVDDFGVNDTSNKTINITMWKSDVWLWNVDNTSDLDKPISTATQTALDWKEDTISDLSTIRDNATAWKSASDTIATYGDIVTHDVSEFATSAQWTLADTAVQPWDLWAVATSNDYTDLDNKPTIGDATITIQKNGTNVDSFKTNATTAKSINITMSKSDVGLWNVDNTSDANKPISTATQSALDAITWKIPSEASTTNQLADKAYVWDSINSVTAYYITKNANGDQFATHAELTSATTFYSWWVVRIPTRNDYCIVADDEDHDHATTRYIYTTTWEFQYVVNETALTTAQLNALNSGITSSKVSTYDGIVTTVWWYWNIVTHNTSEFATSAQWTLADTALQPLDNISELTNNLWFIDKDVNNLTYYPLSSSLSTVATSWSYNDLSNKPTIPTVNNSTITIQKNWTKVKDFTLNQSSAETINITVPTTVAELTDSSNYQTTANMVTSLTNADDNHYPTAKAVSDALSGAGQWDMTKLVYDPNNIWADVFDYTNFINTPNLSTVATSGDYDDLLNKPTIPTVNNATLTIQKNGTTINTFTSNASSNVTANITVPTKVSDLTNDSGFINKSVNDLTNYTLTSNLASVATSGDYTDLSNTPTIPADTSDLTNNAWFITLSDIPSQVSDTAYASSWNWVTDTAPSKNAVYDKINAMDTAISWKADSSSLATVATSGSYNDLSNKPTIPTVNNKTITFTQNGVSVGDITLNQSSDETIAFTDTTYESKTASSGWTDLSLVTTWEKYNWNQKQNALTAQTAYTSKWTSTKVATITTNTLWQVTAITETSISFPVTSVNGSTWAITWLQTTANLKTSLSDNSDSYYPSQKAVKTAVDWKQATLVSWTNIKTINGTSILWSGDITTPNTTYTASDFDIKDLTDSTNLRTTWSGKQDALVSGTNIKTINWNSVLWNGNLTVWTDYSWVEKTISNSEIEIWLRTIVKKPTSNFTLTKPATLSDGEEYVIRTISAWTSYTITLWTWFTNPRNVDLSLSQRATDQFVFVAINWELELQPVVATWS